MNKLWEITIQWESLAEYEQKYSRGSLMNRLKETFSKKQLDEIVNLYEKYQDRKLGAESTIIAGSD